MAYVHIKKGWGHGRQLIGIDFPLVESFKYGSRGLYITVSGIGLAGYPQRNFRILVASKADVEVFDHIVEPNASDVSELGEDQQSADAPVMLRGHTAIPNAMLHSADSTVSFTPVAERPDEPVEVIRERMIERFSILAQLAVSVAQGVDRGLVVYGGPGIGKSFEVEDALKRVNAYNKFQFQAMMDKDEGVAFDPNVLPKPVGYSGNFSAVDPESGIEMPQFYTYFIHKGHITPAAVYALLYNNRHPNQIIISDDSDTLMANEDSLALLKIALDTTRERHIPWTISGNRADALPASFLYEGSIIFITNSDFEAIAQSNSKLSVHVAAILDRCLYLDLMVSSLKEILVRIDYVCRDLKKFRDELLTAPTNVKPEDADAICEELLAWTHDNAYRFRSLSLRKMIHLAKMRKSADNWQRLAEITLLKARK